MYEFKFVGTEQWFKSVMTTPEAVAMHAMSLHGGRIGTGVREALPGLWVPMARRARATSVWVRAVAS